MRRVLSVLLILSLTWAFFGEIIFAQKGPAVRAKSNEKDVIDLTADLVYPIDVNDTIEAMCLVGNFAAQHNGTIITADSAVRYGDNKIECFGQVLINKNTTYVYADAADYDSELSEANLYAPIIKVVDGDTRLYTYNFSFNTETNIGRYSGGGVMHNREDIMESYSGYMMADSNLIIAVEDVELRGSEYEMQGDSVIYNTDTEFAEYFDNTNIWNEKDEYLYADRGEYSKAEGRYSFTKNGYILTAEQEIWSDSMDYYRESEEVYLRSNIQMDDTTQKSLIFGQYGEYHRNPGDLVLTGEPVVLSYDLEQGPDTLFFRADTILMNTFNTQKQRRDSLSKLKADSLSKVKSDVEVTKQQDEQKISSTPKQTQTEQKQTTAPQTGVTPKVDIPQREAPTSDIKERVDSSLEHHTKIKSDSLEISNVDTMIADSAVVDSMVVDSMVIDSLDSLAGLDTLNFWQRLKHNYLAKKAIRDEKRSAKQAIRAIKLDSIAEIRQAKINAELDAVKAREARRVAERKAKIERKAALKRARDVRRGKISVDDTLAIRRELDSIAFADSVALAQSKLNDSLAAADTLKVDSLVVDSLEVEPVVVPDSIYRIMRGLRNVRVYRTDVQAVCDSIVYNSSDSIAHLYVEPILWNEGSQITAEVMNIYTANQQIDKAIFTGNPIMASQINATYFNQVAGKEMISTFVDGEISRHDVDGNAQTIYFMQDEDEKGQATGPVTGMMVIESGGATFYIKGQTIDGITYRGAPAYTLYPLDLVPATQELTLKGFVWQIERQPSREAIFDQPIRPTQRKERSELPRPKFPINENMERQKIELMERSEWGERDELVSPNAEEWLQSLGFKSGQPREEQE